MLIVMNMQSGVSTPLFEKGKGRQPQRMTWSTLLRVLSVWLGVFIMAVQLFPCRAQAGSVQAHGVPLREAVDFYQFSDDNGVIHFVDSLELVPSSYRKQVIVRKETPSARQTTTVLIVGNQMHVPVTIVRENRTVQALMILDTGSSITCITEELAVRLNIDSRQSRPATLRLADGSTINMSLTNIDTLAVGDKLKSQLEIGIIKHSGTREIHDGILGMDFLSEFQYQVDLENQMIRWQ